MYIYIYIYAENKGEKNLNKTSKNKHIYFKEMTMKITRKQGKPEANGITFLK